MSKTLNYALLNWPCEYILHSSWHICKISKIVQNFVSNNIPYNSPWDDYAFFILETKILCWIAWYSLSFSLFLYSVPMFYIWSIWNPYFRAIFHMIAKILHLPLTLSYYLSPPFGLIFPFWLSTDFPFYFQNEWKNVIKIHVVLCPYIYPKIYISPFLTLMLKGSKE